MTSPRTSKLHVEIGGVGRSGGGGGIIYIFMVIPYIQYQKKYHKKYLM